MRIQFLGAVQTVTGSKYLIQTNQINILIDCGLFQDIKSCAYEIGLTSQSILKKWITFY